MMTSRHAYHFTGRLFLALVVFMCGTHVALAQYNSRLGQFQVVEKKGCAAFTVNLTNLLAGECSALFPCSMRFGDNTPDQSNSFTHTYTAPGTYTLSVNYAGSIPTDDIVIVVEQNIQPEFEIHSCNGNQAVIKVIDNHYDQYMIDYTNNGSVDFTIPFSNNAVFPPFNYGAGTHTISVRGRDLQAQQCDAKLQTYTSLASLTAASINTLTSVDAENITLAVTTANFVQYRLQASEDDISFQPFRTLYQATTVPIEDLDLDDNFYCFQLGAHDPCTNVTTFPAVGIVCTNNLDLTTQSDQITVNSGTATVPGLVNYTLARTSPTAPPVTISGTPLNPYPDTDVECKTTYCYRVTTNYSSGRTSVSLEKCATAFSDAVPTAIDDVTATVGPGGASLIWVQDPLFVPNGYTISRSSAGSPFGPYASAPISPFVDNIYTTDGKYCYEINYIDKCDNASAPGTPACPVQLTGVLDSNNGITVNWSRHRGWKAGVKHYVLEKYDVNGDLIQSIVQSDTFYIDNAPDPVNQYVRYVVRAIPNNLAVGEARSNERIFIRSSHLFYPTAFTPNRDNLNDDFVVQGQYIVSLKLSVFDRWGSLLFSTEKNEAWDGSSKGRAMPPSTYVWKVDITDRAGQRYSREGTIALIRD